MTTLITGGSKGIGFAIAAALIAAYPEIQLAICARHPEEVAKAAGELQSKSSRARVLGIECDVAQETSIHECVTHVQRAFGSIDVLINNAGFGIFKRVEDLSEEEFNSVIATNLRGVFIMTREVVPQMIERGTGTIMTIASLAGKNGFANGSAYCASKFGVRGMMESLFLQVRSSNVRVATIFPGSVDTDFFSTANYGSLRSKTALMADDVAQAALSVLRLPQSALISELDLRPTNPK